jgi:replication factor A1
MAINELKANQGNVVVIGTITQKGDIREFDKFGKKGKVCNAIIKDETGSVKLTLWNDDISKVENGDKVKIENGWVSEWKGELQLSTGKFGKIEVVEKGAGEAMPEQPPIEPKPAKKEEKGTLNLYEKEEVDEDIIDEEEFIEDDDKEY